MRRTIGLALLAISLSCADPSTSAVVLASTTSTQDSGLFDFLLPAFERSHAEYKIRLIAVGSGEALAIGRRGDADVLLVHSPAAETSFMEAGSGESRRSVMSNRFVLVGSAADPAKVRGLKEIAEAFHRIAAARAPFLSRGDNSGTHVKEQQIWALAGSDTTAERGWYSEVGQGMAETLRMTSERGAYTLTDESTYSSQQSKLRLEVLVEGDPRLNNPYSVIVVRSARNAAGARAFAEWITSPQGQQLIASFGREQFGRSLFSPALPDR